MVANLVSPRADCKFHQCPAVLLAAMLCAQPAALAAQDETAPPRLEELIPDRAISAPEAWAGEGAPDTGDTGDALPTASPGFDALEIPDRPAPLGDAAAAADDAEAGEGELFADLETLDLPPPPPLEWVRIDEGLELAFPAEREFFADRDAFIARFRQLREAEGIAGGRDNVALRASRIRADRELLERQLRAYGYYDARVTRSLEEQRADGGRNAAVATVRFAVQPGVRYRFGAIDLGQLESAPDHEQLRATFGIASGDPLLADRILERRDALAVEMGESGYPFAAIAPPELLIDHARSEGDLTLEVAPGGKYVFAEITSDKPRFLPGKHLERIARFDSGDLYRRSLEQDLRRAVLATGLVSSVGITPRVISEPQGDEPGELALDVELEKGRLRTIAGAIGYGSEDGVKIEASWEHRNLFPPEGALKLRGILGTREALAGIGFKRNNFRGRDQLLTLDAYASDLKTESVEARTIGLRGAFERHSNLLFQKPLSWLIGAEVLLTDERNRIVDGIERPRQEYLVGSVFARGTIDESDSLLDPARGYRLSAFLAPEAVRTQGRESFYLRGQLDASYYLPAGEGIVLAARGRLATIDGAPTGDIPPSRRLYAGGGSSVRGYGYQAVGPRNELGEPIGGRSLVELSAEVRIDTGLFDGAVQIVPFFDLGSVSRDTVPDLGLIRYGIGAGLRYKTGFGPIRVDVATPLNRDPAFDSPVAVYVSLGQAF